MNRIQIARSILYAAAALALVAGCSSAEPANLNSASTASLKGSDDDSPLWAGDLPNDGSSVAAAGADRSEA